MLAALCAFVFAIYNAQSLTDGFDLVDVDYPIVLLHRDRTVLPICSTH